MKKLFLMGRSEAGKTSLAQVLRGERPHYHKTQYTYANSDTIDTPGEYSESNQLGVGLACFSFEADVIAIVIAADEPFSVFAPNCGSFLNRPLIGIITKIDSPYANIAMVRQWLINSGCEQIFLINNMTGDGVEELKNYLKSDFPRISLDEAKVHQRQGLRDWDIIPKNL
ncbi:EutP/PduV family microcompartment system protein [Alkalibaculum bacchi]|jgi:ethanolamine utilization protein EutP|uniref:EutP/PduV family microcompartment system protein n=1 Tax=Alkalibaculum bacchi TaxID=645887 RepID=UPI0026E91F05|nr:EutP/PduV family microcompartment system protein [Alkalibaculum bacchi]